MPLALLVTPSLLRAQEPIPYRVAPEFTAPAVMAPAVLTDRLPVEWEETGSTVWRGDLLLGLPTGVRVSVELSHASALVPAVEGFLGLYLAVLPTAGAGLRWTLPALRGEHDALVFRPGIDALVMTNPFTSDSGWFAGGRHGFGLVAGTVDCLWQHHFDRRWCSEFGLEIGAGPLFNSRNGVVVPVASVFLGFRH
jgi:hypothetical protein